MVLGAGSGLSVGGACVMYLGTLLHARASGRRHGVGWILDPSNTNLRFDRARMRKVGSLCSQYRKE